MMFKYSIFQKNPILMLLIEANLKNKSVNTPDRPIFSFLLPIRQAVRLIRLGKHILLLRHKLKLGHNIVFGKDALLQPPEFMEIGNNVYFGPWFVLQSNLKVGDDVLFSSRVACISNDHAYDDANKSIIDQGRLKPNTITIEGDNLIGFGTIIVGDVRIGKGCIIGAGSVVTKDLPPYTICAGVPAKPIKMRYEKT